jgi:hypothetical protein
MVRFKFLSAPSESELLQESLVEQSHLDCLWDELKNLAKSYDNPTLGYYMWCKVSVPIQYTIANFLVLCGFSESHFDRIGDILYSVIPRRLRESLGDYAHDFVEALLYPHRSGANLDQYKRLFNWMKTLTANGKPYYSTEWTYPSTENLTARLIEDFKARQVDEEYMRSVSISSLIDSTKGVTKKQSTYQAGTGMLFQGRFQFFAFAVFPVSYETVATLLDSIYFCTAIYDKFLRSPNGAILFANFYLPTMLLDNDGSSIPVGLFEMAHHAVYAYTQCPNPKHFGEDHPIIARRFTLARWFTPWIGIDLSDRHIKSPNLVPYHSGRQFLELFKAEYAKTMQILNIGSSRTLPVSESDIDRFKTSVVKLFEATELDLDMMENIFRPTTKTKFQPDSSMRGLLLYCIQNEMPKLYNIEIPKVASIPSEWFKASSVEDPKYFTGSDKSLYPAWRQSTMESLLLSTSSKEYAKTLIYSFLKSPILAEVQLAIDISSRSSSRKRILCEIFQYLDKAFKFKTDKQWMGSDLYKNIQQAISGISDSSEKEVAKIASTWKCQTFEMYMEIVSLF